MKRETLEENPFLVLEIEATASRMEIERAGQKLLAQLAIDTLSAKTYSTPFGSRARDEAKVRTALAALRNPEERVLHELWARAFEDGEAAELPQWRRALESVGWRAP